MQLAIQSYNGVSLQTSELSAYTDHDFAFNQAPSRVVDVERHGNAPAYVDTVRVARRFKVKVAIIGGTYHSNIATLKALFKTQDRTLRTLIVYDSANSNRSWQILCKCETQELSSDSPVTEQVFNMYAPDGILKATTQTTESTWSITATPSTKNITPLGTIEVAPIFDITPTTVKAGGFAYKRFIIAYNPNDVQMLHYPLDVTYGGLDTDALTTAKMQADGDDLRIYIDGVETNRWLQSMDTVATKVWAVINFQAKIELTIAAAGSGDTTITFQNTTANNKALARLPNSGIGLFESEIISWTAKDVKARTITGVTRGIKGTTAATHAAAITFRWLEHEIWMYYGNSSLAAPETDDTEKPIFELTSTNTSWVYNVFATLLGKRAGEWRPALLNYKAPQSAVTSRYYSTTQVGDDSDPATDMGMKIAAWLNGVKSTMENAAVAWQLYHPGGITTVTSSGKKNKSGSSWPSALLQYSKNKGQTWVTKWTEAAPSGSYDALTNTGAQSLGVTAQLIRFILTGGVAASGEAEMEMATVTVVPDSAKVPQGSLGAEQASNYELDAKITNNASGEWIALRFSMELNQTLRVDCANRRVTYLKDNTQHLEALTLSSTRINWLDIAGIATSQLQYDETGVVAVSVVVKYNDRQN